MAIDVYLKRNEEKRISDGQCWVYANEVAKIEGKDKNGSLATVFTYDGKYVGKGYINHLSKILVRIFIRDDSIDDKQLYLTRLNAANDYRKSLGYDNCYRMVFGEADNLPALIVDKYDDVLVIQCLSLGIDLKKQLIVECLVELFSPKGIYERSDASVRNKEGLQEITGALYGEVPDKVIITENGIKLSVDVKNGQKTGYFLDQKENRFAIRRFCKDKCVLDCFSNSGGFSMNALTVAKEVTAVDISKDALQNVLENAKLNGFTNVTTVEGDVFEVLREYKKAKRSFDVVILDPPAFCKSASQVNDAIRGYLDINILAMKLVKSGGFLITSSCSQHVTLSLFNNMLVTAASKSGRTIRLAELKSQAADHPSLLLQEQTQYLKFYVLNVI